MMDLHVIPECYIDTKLCKVLVPPASRYNHQKGCPNVAKVMREKLGNDFALGIVDRDKLELTYFKEFDLITEIPENIQLLKHKSEPHHYLIFIRPTMEKWIIFCAEESGISLGDFGLPDDFRQLLKITKTSKSENEDVYSSNFRDLFKEFGRLKSHSIATLTFWIEYLKGNPSSADLGHIQEKTIEILNS
jgi:hypothetical protein